MYNIYIILLTITCNIFLKSALKLKLVRLHCKIVFEYIILN